jgi:hypothetical protein
MTCSVMQEPCKLYKMSFFIKLNLINKLRQKDSTPVKIGIPLIGVYSSQLTEIW